MLAMSSRQKTPGNHEPNQMKTVLLVDDDIELREYIATVLKRNHYQVYCANNGKDSLYNLNLYQPDLVLLDIRLPDMDGIKLCQQIRQLSRIPIIFLSVIADEASIIQGLDSGANDYLIKPISGPLLLAHIRAALRWLAGEPNREKPLTYADDYLVINVAMRQVLIAGKPVALTTTEFRLLTYLLQYAGQVRTTTEILEHVWGKEYRDSPEYVYTYISYLRRKLEKEPKHPRYLLAEHRIGYKFVGQLAQSQSARH